MLFTQLIPSSTYPLRREMKALTYQALIDWSAGRPCFSPWPTQSDPTPAS